MGSSDKSPEWCFYSIPNLYGYIQSEYWGVGFLKSYEPGRIIDLIIGLQSIFIGYLGLVGYTRRFRKNE